MIAARWQTRAAAVVAVAALVAGLAVMLAAAPADAGGRHHPTTTTTVPELVIECPPGTHPVGTTGHSLICVPDSSTPSTRPAMTSTTTSTTAPPSSVSLVPPLVVDAPAAAPVETTPAVTG